MRRGHGSTKVPNVKLRPAAVTFKPKPPTEAAWDDMDQTDEIEQMKLGGKRPFRRIVISATGVSDKAALFRKAEELGAQTSLDLTDKVTHLIAERPGSAKYTYCISHGIPVVRSSWVLAAYDSWIHGDDVDATQTLTQHRLLPFVSVRLSILGITSEVSVKKISETVSKYGGTYLGEYHNSSKPSHLLCGDEYGDIHLSVMEKIRSERKIKIVWEQWLWDCLDACGILDETAYDVSKPQPGPRKRRDDSVEPSSSNGSRAQRRIIPESIPSSSLHSNADKEESARIKQIPEYTSRLWEGITKKRGYEVKDGHLVRSPTKSQSVRSDLRSELCSSPVKLQKMTFNKEGKSSALSAFQRYKSFSSSNTGLLDPAAKQDLRIDTKLFPVVSESGALDTTQTSQLTSNPLTSATSSFMTIPVLGENSKANYHPLSTLFKGYIVFPLGDARSRSLYDAIVDCGGKVASSIGPEVDFYIVRLVSGSTYFRDEKDETRRNRYRTECWVERCIHEERICPPDEHIAFLPLSINTPVEGAPKLIIHISGLDASEKCWTARLIRAIGGTISDKFSRKTTHLICPSASGLKYDRAVEWSIPVLTTDWLFETAKTGFLPSLPNFLVLKSSVAETRNSQPVEIKMANITNSQGRLQPGSSAEPTFELGTFTSTLDPVENLSQFNPQCTSTQPNDLITSLEPNSTKSPNLRAPLSKSTSLPVQNSTKCSTKSGYFSAENEDPRLVTLPSSNTPSPLKLPTIQRTHSSPMVSGDTARVLKNITTLLGKRSEHSDSEPPPIQKTNKRVRPTRTRSRQEIQFSGSEDRNHSVPPTSPSTSYFAGSGYLHTVILEDDEPEESMQVTYEDPGQREERLKLLRLLGGEPPAPNPRSVDNDNSRPKVTTEVSSSSKPGRRRSARISGF